MKTFPKNVTLGELYDPAMKVKTQEEANECLKSIVYHTMIISTPKIKTRQETIDMVKQNIGYWAGYFDEETQDRVYKLYKTQHPVFGLIRPTAEQAFQKGIEFGEKLKRKKT